MYLDLADAEFSGNLCIEFAGFIMGRHYSRVSCPAQGWGEVFLGEREQQFDLSAAGVCGARFRFVLAPLPLFVAPSKLERLRGAC